MIFKNINEYYIFSLNPGKTDGTSAYVLVETLVGRDIVKNREVILKLRLTAMTLDKSTYHYNNYKVSYKYNLPLYSNDFTT